ncbi:MAG TPA: hypothetical protein PKV98_09330 [Burkholderiaceae bacterium]|nr:hypothetical protein [Burkholderiaceae bacterium]
MQHGVQTAFTVIENEVSRTASQQVLEDYRRHVMRLTVGLDRCAGETRGRLIAEEDLIEQGRALLLKIDQRIAEESVPERVSNVHPIFDSLLAPFVHPAYKQAA